MSKSGIPQEARLFVPFPDGKALLYELKGQALEPPVEMKTTFPIETKKTEVLKIPVVNWLGSKQCFSVNWTLNKPDPSIVLRGGGAIDLNGKEKKDYKLNVLCYNEGEFTLTLTFTNKLSKEFMF